MTNNYEKLTKRELQVANFIVTGYRTKEIAKELGISRRTINVHRLNLMKKMEVKNIASLVKVATKRDVKQKLNRALVRGVKQADIQIEKLNVVQERLTDEGASQHELSSYNFRQIGMQEVKAIFKEMIK